MAKEELLKEPYPWSSDIVFPDVVKEQINAILSLAASAHGVGIEMRHVFLGIDPAGETYFMDTTGVPHEVLPSWVMMHADKSNAVVLVSSCEGYTLPEELLKDWAKTPNRGSISDHPDHFEILMVSVETQKGHWIGQSRIIKDGDKFKLSGPINLFKADQAKGRLTNLLKCHWRDDPIGTLRKTDEAKKYYEKNGHKV